MYSSDPSTSGCRCLAFPRSTSGLSAPGASNDDDAEGGRGLASFVGDSSGAG